MNGAKNQSGTMSGALAALFLLSAFSLLVLPVLPALAGEPGAAAASFLKFAPGPRGTGMGEAYTSVAGDAYAAWWNPAGLAAVEVPEAAAAYNASFQDVAHQYLSVAYPLRYGSTLGLNVNRLTVAPFQGYDAVGNKTREIESSAMSVGAVYARTLLKDEIERPVFSVGLGLKTVAETLDSAGASTFAADLGALYYLRPEKYWMKKVPAQELRLALAVRNLGPGLAFDKESFPLPASVTLGASWISHPWGAHTLTLALDNTLAADDSHTLNLGAEYFMYQLLSFRAGFRTGQEIGPGFRLGVGFKLSFADLDYSMSPFGELGAMHKAGLTMRFGMPAAGAPLAGRVARVEGGKVLAKTETLEKLDLFARDYLALAEKDLAARRYLAALDNLGKAFNLEPRLREGDWGGREQRLRQLSRNLRFREDAALERAFSAAGEQAAAAHEAVEAYVQGRELKALLLAHAARGADIRGPAVFEGLLYTLAELTRSSIRRDEILPRTALVKEKLRKSARHFYTQQFDLAAKECEEAVLLDEKNHIAWTRLGSAYFMLGDKAKAREAYTRVLELRPDDAITREFMRSQGWRQ